MALLENNIAQFPLKEGKNEILFELKFSTDDTFLGNM